MSSCEPHQPSKSAVRRAGSKIRRWSAGEATREEYEASIAVVEQYRALHTLPLVKVNNGLRRFCASLQIEGQVTQRLKKEATIVSKLTRESGLDLSRMQDIGGCRVVVKDHETLRRLESRICSSWSTRLVRTSDYIAEPRASGYRAVHLVVRWDERAIEIQLRTETMHAWAQTVEMISESKRTNFKQDGDHLVQDFMALMSKFDAYLEQLGPPLTQAELDKLHTMGEQVTAFLS